MSEKCDFCGEVLKPVRHLTPGMAVYVVDYLCGCGCCSDDICRCAEADA